MPKFNVDEQSQLAEPIEVVLEGKTYVAGKITTDLMNKVTALAKDKEDIDAPIKQLALLLNADFAELKDIDIRKIGKALEFITKTVTESMEKPKN